MTTKEQITQELDSLSEADLGQIAEPGIFEIPVSGEVHAVTGRNKIGCSLCRIWRRGSGTG